MSYLSDERYWQRWRDVGLFAAKTGRTVAAATKTAYSLGRRILRIQYTLKKRTFYIHHLGRLTSHQFYLQSSRRQHN